MHYEAWKTTMFEDNLKAISQWLVSKNQLMLALRVENGRMFFPASCVFGKDLTLTPLAALSDTLHFSSGESASAHVRAKDIAKPLFEQAQACGLITAARGDLMIDSGGGVSFEGEA